MEEQINKLTNEVENIAKKISKFSLTTKIFIFFKLYVLCLKQEFLPLVRKKGILLALFEYITNINIVSNLLDVHKSEKFKKNLYKRLDINNKCTFFKFIKLLILWKRFVRSKK